MQAWCSLPPRLEFNIFQFRQPPQNDQKKKKNQVLEKCTIISKISQNHPANFINTEHVKLDGNILKLSANRRLLNKFTAAFDGEQVMEFFKKDSAHNECSQ